MKTPISPRDLENLSAFLDGQLTEAERKQVETRLAAEPELRATFEGLRQTRALLKSLPKKRAPRNFTLTLKMAGVKPRRSLAPIFGWASAMATILLLSVLFFDFMSPGAPSTSSVAFQNTAPQMEAPAANAQAEPQTEQFSAKALLPTETAPPPAAEVMGSLDSAETSQAAENTEPGIEAGSELSPMEPTPASPVITGPMGLQQVAPAQPTPTVTPTMPATQVAEQALPGERTFAATPTAPPAGGGGEPLQPTATSLPSPTYTPEEVIVEAPVPTSQPVAPQPAESPPFLTIEIALAGFALLSALVALILRRAAR